MMPKTLLRKLHVCSATLGAANDMFSLLSEPWEPQSIFSLLSESVRLLSFPLF